jgi:hypothetical protein
MTAALVLSTIAGVGVANGATTPAPPAPLAVTTIGDWATSEAAAAGAGEGKEAIR